MTIHWKAVEQFFTIVFTHFTQFVSLEKLSVFGLSRVKGLRHFQFIKAISSFMQLVNVPCVSLFLLETLPPLTKPPDHDLPVKQPGWPTTSDL